MTRRAFVAALGAVLAVAMAAEAQEPKTARIGFLLGSTLSSPNVQIEPFKPTLRENGWVEGRNLTLTYRFAEGHCEQLRALAGELIDGGVDLIVTDGTPPTQAAMRATTTLPIVMATTGDPVAISLVSNLARPGGNVTGASSFLPEISARRLECSKKRCHSSHASPSSRRVSWTTGSRLISTTSNTPASS